jgi:hypothetical protein
MIRIILVPEDTLVLLRAKMKSSAGTFGDVNKYTLAEITYYGKEKIISGHILY